MAYNKTNWQNLPNQTTPVNSTNLNKIENGIADSYNSIGFDAYDNTSTYDVGDFCIYNNTLYRCTTAITTAEAFNSGHWAAKTVKELIENLETNLPLFTTTNGSTSITVNSKDTNTVTVSPSNVPAGYEVLGIKAIWCSGSASGSAVISRYNWVDASQSYEVGVYNNNNSNRTWTINVVFNLIKTGI